MIVANKIRFTSGKNIKYIFISIIILTATIFTASPSTARTGIYACIWGAPSDEYGKITDFQWKGCKVDQNDNARCDEKYQSVSIFSKENDIGYVAIQWHHDDIISAQDGTLSSDGYFQIKFDESFESDHREKIVYTRLIGMTTGLPRDETQICRDRTVGYRFVRSMTGVKIYRGCPKEDKKCLD